jgi:DNA-binding response OmpR family regulator
MPKQNIFFGKRILVLEDDPMIAAEMAVSLAEHGSEVVGPFPSVDDAFRILDQGISIQGAVLDVSLQGKPVFPFADQLRSRHIPFVFATGFDDSAIPAAFSEYAHFNKPISIAQIARALLR